MAGATDTRRILVGLDFEELGDRALQAAISLASASGDTEVHAVYVRPVLEGAPVSRRDVSAMEEDVELLRTRVREQIDVYRAEHGEPSVKEVAVHRATGTPAREIARVAAALNAGLIVVGTHGRRGLKRAVLGSVAETLVRIAGCPVLVMRSVDHPAAEGMADEVEPVCAECSKVRDASQGASLWCARHSEHHGRAHVFSYGGPPTGSPRPWGFS
jgi:nucleotide-binding universal stress UspA family protein